MYLFLMKPEKSHFCEPFCAPLGQKPQTKKKMSFFKLDNTLTSSKKIEHFFKRFQSKTLEKQARP